MFKQKVQENEEINTTTSLSIQGDIATGAIGAIIHLQGSQAAELIVHGNVHQKVNIVWIGKMTFKKDVKKDVKITNHRGDIFVDGTAEYCHLRAHNGNITISKLSASIVTVHKGNIKVTSLEGECKLTVHKGNVVLKSIENDNSRSKLTVYKGNFYTHKALSSKIEYEIFSGTLVNTEAQVEDSRPVRHNR